MKKKITYKQEQKRAKALKIIKWVCAGLGWSALLTCLILLLSLGVKGCNKKQPSQSAAISEVNRQQLVKKSLSARDFPYYYVLDYTQDSTNIFTSLQNEVCDEFGVPTQNYSTNQDPIFYTEEVTDLYASREGFYVPVNSFTIKFSTYVFLSNYRYAIEFVSVNIEEVNYNIINKSSTGADSYLYAVNRIDHSGMALNFYGGDSDDTTSYLLNWLYHKGEATHVHFNNQINYNAPFYATYEQLFIIDSDFQNNFTVKKNIDFDIGFISNGKLYTRISVWYFQGNGVMYLDGNELKTNNTIGSGYFAEMEYVNTDTGESAVVNMRDYQYKNGGSTYLLPTSTWVSELYQDIYILDENQPLITKVTVFNNNISGINGGVGGLGGTDNIFDLLTRAFSSVASILGIMVLPGISLGLLIFMPIVIFLVVLVFKAVKK